MISVQRKRLRLLEAAARALGQGQIDVRATIAGATRSRAGANVFNGMAAELQSRAAALSASDRARRCSRRRLTS